MAVHQGSTICVHLNTGKQVLGVGFRKISEVDMIILNFKFIMNVTSRSMFSKLVPLKSLVVKSGDRAGYLENVDCTVCDWPISIVSQLVLNSLPISVELLPNASKWPIGTIQWDFINLCLIYFLYLLDCPSYPCMKCGRQYRRKTNLFRHLKVECGKVPLFKCHFCTAAFKYKHVLQRHFQSKH